MPIRPPKTAEAMTQLHQMPQPKLKSASAWPIRPISRPATGPKSAAMKASRPYWMEMLVLGTGLGMATKRASTKNSAAPMPMATTVTMGDFFMVVFSFIFIFGKRICAAGKKSVPSADGTPRIA